MSAAGTEPAKSGRAGGQEVIRVRSGVTNSYLIRSRKTVIVDAGDPGFSSSIIKAMEAHGIKPADVSLILLTHGHIDHFGSVYKLKQTVPAPVAIHELDAPYFNSGVHAPLSPIEAFPRFLSFFGSKFKIRKRYGVKADILFQSELDLTPFGIDGRVVHTPAHTSGSSSLVLPDGRAISGDLSVRRWFLWGVPECPPFLQAPFSFLPSCQRLKDNGVKTLLPGHGKPIPLEKVRLSPPAMRIVKEKKA